MYAPVNYTTVALLVLAALLFLGATVGLPKDPSDVGKRDEKEDDDTPETESRYRARWLGWQWRGM
jgi:hypothetical protein